MEEIKLTFNFLYVITKLIYDLKLYFDGNEQKFNYVKNEKKVERAYFD